MNFKRNDSELCVKLYLSWFLSMFFTLHHAAKKH